MISAEQSYRARVRVSATFAIYFAIDRSVRIFQEQEGKNSSRYKKKINHYGSVESLEMTERKLAIVFLFSSFDAIQSTKEIFRFRSKRNGSDKQNSNKHTALATSDLHY